MRLLLMGGSLRPESLNARLLRHLAADLRARGHEVSTFTGEALRLPLLEEGLAPSPETRKLHEALSEAQGLVIVSPEYNAGIPGHLKNALDWLSIMKPSPWTGLPVLLCAASPGAFGGARSLMAWRITLANMGAMALAEGLTVPHADKQLDAEGAPLDARTAAAARCSSPGCGCVRTAPVAGSTSTASGRVATGSARTPSTCSSPSWSSAQASSPAWWPPGPRLRGPHWRGRAWC